MSDKQTGTQGKSQAHPYMILDILKKILGAADQPNQLSDYLTSQMRELTGAKTVVLSRCASSSSENTTCSLLSICPLRKENTFVKRVACELHPYCRAALSPVFVDKNCQKEPYITLMKRKECKNLLFAPLRIGNDLIGSLLFMDLPETLRSKDFLEVLEPLTPVAAAILRNSFLYENLEEKVAARTKALQASEKKYRELLEVMPDWVWAMDNEGTCTFTNNAVTKILGYETAEFVRLGFFSLIHEDEREQMKERFHECARTKTGWERVALQMKHKDGSLCHMESTAEPILEADGRFQGFTGMDRDVTETVNADKLFKTLINSMVGTTGQVYFDRVVDGLCELLGVECAIVGELQPGGERVQALSMRLGKDFVQEFSYPLAGSPCEQVMGSGFHCVPSSVLNLYPHNLDLQKMKAESYIGTSLLNAEQEPIGVLCCISSKPLTLPPKAKELMKILATRTAAEIERRRSDRRQKEMEEQVRHAQKLESLGVLAGGIAHDFNNLLMSIMGNAELATMDIAADSPSHERIGEIEAATQKAANLCRQMLAYCGQGRFVVASVNLTQVVEEMQQLLQASLSKKIDLKLELDKSLPAIDADAGQMRQTIMNLVSNASEAIGEEQGQVTIRTYVHILEESDLRESFLENDLPKGAYVCLEVSDTGVGMSAETREKIFEPFFTTKFTGRGLGMAAVLGIARGHRGALKIESDLGVGSSLRLLLPPSEREVIPLVDKTKDSKWKSSGKALLVDDEEQVRHLCAKMLNRIGFEVIAVKDGREAIDAFQKWHSELRFVILDMSMPKMDGSEAFAELKKINADVPVIIASGYSQQQISEEFADKMPEGFIQKPYGAAILTDKIRSVLA